MNVMIRFVALLTLLAVGAVAEGQATRPSPLALHVMIISIDGCRPDLLLRADTPVVKALLGESSFTFWARTTLQAVTLPSHVSMMTGVIPRIHQIEWNHDLPLAKAVYPAVPTLFELAKAHGYTTAMAAGKSKFGVFNRPGALDECFLPESVTVENGEVVDAAVGMIRSGRPGVLFVHLPGADTAGHRYGWASAEQMRALHDADVQIGRLLRALDEAGLRASTAVLITADHGGAGRAHGEDDPRSRYIPWILSGPGVRRGMDLTTFPGLEVRTEDTFATAAWLLGIAVDPSIEGHAVKEALEPARGELLHAANE